ncbi:MAG TPA: response regulator transcription factor [Ktedonobacteraceae bacterium]|nr:response regulator transcription factor [Ktedonobacteraceae bacterium]
MSERQEPVRIVVVDDHLVVREGLRMMLEIARRGFILVGEAADGANGLRVIEELQPDVVLMDLRMPGMDGIETIMHLRQRWPHIAVVILTTYDEDELMVQGLRAGARGYLLKDTDRETLFQAVQLAARGDMLIQPEIMARILAHHPPPESHIPPEPPAMLANEALTDREREILQAIARGERSKEIATHLGIGIRTVGSHITNIYLKLNVDSRASAVAVALERGLLEDRG